MPAHCAIGQYQIAAVDGGGDVIDDKRMVETVSDPRPEGGHAKEDGCLRKTVKLRIAVEEAGGDELVEDAKGERWEDGKEDVVEGEGPGLHYHGARKAILEGVLERHVNVCACD